MKRRLLVTALGISAVLTAGVTLAATSPRGILDDLFQENRKERYRVEHSINRHTILEVTRSPLSPSGLVTVSVDLTIDATDYLQSLELYSGGDTDEDGTLETGEWSLEATGTITEVNGQTHGTIGDTTISALADAYRVVMVDNEIGTTYDQWGNLTLAYEDP